MPLTKTQKKKIIDTLKEKIAKQKAMIFIDFTGLKIKEFSNLRKKLKENFGELKVVKKTLLQFAIKDYNPSVAQDVKKLKGEIALVFGYKDEMSLTKMVYQFSKEHPSLKILGGILENKLKGAEDIITLAQLPTREELLVKLVGTISAPISNFLIVLEGNIKGLIYLLSVIKK